MTICAVIFDLDFTLIDSSEAVIQCARVGFEAAGLQAPADELIVQCIGMSFQEFAARHAGEHAAQVIAGFRNETHRLEWLDSISLMPHARETLAYLHQQDMPLGMATQKSKPALDAILQHLDLHRYFRAVVSGDCVAYRKPAPDALLECIQRLEVCPQTAVYVGDHPYDVLAARAAGIHSIAITTGPTPVDELTALQPNWMIGSLEELPPILLSLPVRIAEKNEN